MRKERKRGGAQIRPRLRVGFVLLAVLSITMGCQSGEQADGVSSSDRSAMEQVELAGEGEPAVELVIDYGDGAERRFTRIPCEEGMTVLAALVFAAKHPRGITFDKSGKGEAALLTKIDDLANQQGGEGKNWLYRVNGKLADKSFGAYVLSPGDVILWRFAEYE